MTNYLLFPNILTLWSTNTKILSEYFFGFIRIFVFVLHKVRILPIISKYPDFMEHKYKNSYKSEKVLGKLYRNIKIDNPKSDPLLKYYVGNISPNEDFLFDG